MKEIKQTRKAKEEFKSEILPLLFSDENVTYDELKLKLGKKELLAYNSSIFSEFFKICLS